jgi:hypothetical protein
MRTALAAATRDEVDAYERELRRRRWGLLVGASAVALAAGLATVFVANRRERRSGTELEPNDTPAHATQLDRGAPLTAHLGERIDSEHGDRDFYGFDVKDEGGADKPTIALRVSALPNIPMCTMLYRPGFEEPLARYCVGHPGRDLVIPALALEPGHYLAAVVQDLSPFAGAPPFVYENVSDTYTVSFDVAHRAADAEVEPNDTVMSAEAIEPGASRTGAIGWAHDEDVFCVAEGTTGSVRFRARTGPRESGVLEATPLTSDGASASVRIHDEDPESASAFDVGSPWQSDPLAPIGSRCLRLRLVPKAGESGVPYGGPEPYVVEVETVPGK